MIKSEQDEELIARMREDRHVQIREEMVQMYLSLREMGMPEMEAGAMAVTVCHMALSFQEELEFLNTNKERLSKADQN